MLALRMKKAARNGATLVVADPRKIWLTKLAKRHLQLRPGSDVWLVNAMMHVILKEGLQNEEYIREHTEDFDAVAEVVSRYTPEEAEKVTGVPAADIVATAREYATEKHAAIFYTLGITEHACAVDNIWSLSNLVLMTGHLGYESTGLNALRGQNNVQGLNDAGANPAYSPRLSARRRRRDQAEVLRGLGRRGARGARLPARPDDVRSPRRADQGALPHRREPGADGAERPPRRGRTRAPRLPHHAGPLPERHDRAARRRRLPRLELRREGRHVHEHRAPREPRPQGGPVPGRGARGLADRRRHGEGPRRQLARVPDCPRTPGTSSPTCRRSGRASATTASRRSACSGRAPTATTPERRSCTRRARRGRAARASSTPSSTSRRSSSPTPSTRSSSRPGARSTTTTRRR